MTRSPFFPSFDQLGATLPVFPLTNVLLLPRGQLPLNIFEPRYIAMVDDALAGDRMIGMVQPRGAGAALPLYDVGCAGRITSFDETDDGRYLITLTGVCRFRVCDELATTRGYRRVTVDWGPYADDLEDAGPCTVDRTRLIDLLSSYFERHGLSANWSVIREAPVIRLVTSLAMICPFDGIEKQALLEAESVNERAQLLLSLIEMALLDREGDDGARH